MMIEGVKKRCGSFLFSMVFDGNGTHAGTTEALSQTLSIESVKPGSHVMRQKRRGSCESQNCRKLRQLRLDRLSIHTSVEHDPVSGPRSNRILQFRTGSGSGWILKKSQPDQIWISKLHRSLQ